MTIVCGVCGKPKRPFEVVSGHSVDASVAPYVLKSEPSWTAEAVICRDCINAARSSFVEASLTEEKGSLSEIERDVIQSIRDHEIVAEPPFEDDASKLSLGDRMSDRLASFGGSWIFIGTFLGLMGVWFLINSAGLLKSPFDPYPYILLNLVLSCLAALQAPVIMMSQNRQEHKDRLRSEADYKTNLKAELEIRHLHIKMDQLLSQQWHRLLEIQKIQTDLLQDLSDHIRNEKSSKNRGS